MGSSDPRVPVPGARFTDPWVHAFHGRGVRTFLDNRDGSCCCPVAVLPSVAAVGPKLSNLAEWFSVAAMSSARGFRLQVMDEVGAGQDPESPQGASDRPDTPPPAYEPGNGGLQAALAAVSRSLHGRALPEERADRNDGYCYLAVIKPSHHEQAQTLLGPWPTLRRLAVLPLEWYEDSSTTVGVGVTVRRDTLHFQAGGGDGVLAAFDVVQYARVSLSRARGECGEVDDLLLDALVGGHASDFEAWDWFRRLQIALDTGPVLTEDNQRLYVGAHCTTDGPHCVVAALKSLLGPVGFRSGDTLRDLCPSEAVRRLAERMMGKCMVTLVRMADRTCMLKGEVGVPGPRLNHLSLAAAIGRLYASNETLCCSYLAPVNLDDTRGTCDDCGYDVVLKDHSARCSIAMPVHSLYKMAAWEGDGVHMCDVRYAFASRDCPPEVATIRASGYVDGRAQAAYLRTFHGGEASGLTDKQASTYFEANYMRIRDGYRAWLDRAVEVEMGHEVTMAALQLDESHGTERHSYVCPHYGCTFRASHVPLMREHIRRHGSLTKLVLQCVGDPSYVVQVKGAQPTLHLWPFLVQGRHWYVCPLAACSGVVAGDDGCIQGFVKHMQSHSRAAMVHKKCVSLESACEDDGVIAATTRLILVSAFRAYSYRDTLNILNAMLNGYSDYRNLARGFAMALLKPS